MNVFVTGGSGFVGGHVIERLVADGHVVQAMARSARSEARVEAFGARAVRCDLGSVTKEHLAGVQAVVHCAAFVEEWGSREEYVSTNVDGTTQLLLAAKEAAVRRFVHIGTEAAVFDGGALIDIDETHPYPSRQRFLYSETKAEAERRVLAASDAEFVAISLRPRFVWGPRDETILPAIVRMSKSWLWIDGGHAQTSTTHVANLAHAVALALEAGRGGESYFVADEGSTTFRAFLSLLAGTRGVELLGPSLPRGFVRATASAFEWGYRLVGSTSPPPITRLSAAMMSTTVTVRTDKAERELGYAPIVRVADGLAGLATSVGD